MENRNLIGISGRAGSGKDTVGAIIQYLTATDTSSKALGFIKLGYDIKGHHNSKFEVKKFAGKLKTVASLLSGANIEDFEDQEFKKGRMTADWGMTYREFLQKLGTEAMRDGLHENVWVNALFADYKATVKEWDEYGNDRVIEYPSWIITDMRFPNEMEAIEERGGITIRVNRPGADVGTHPSETALDDAEFHYTINNHGTLEELIEGVKKILLIEGIL